MSAQPFPTQSVTWRSYFANAGSVVRRFLGVVWLLLALALALFFFAGGQDEGDGSCSASEIAVGGC